MSSSQVSTDIISHRYISMLFLSGDVQVVENAIYTQGYNTKRTLSGGVQNLRNP